MAYRSKTSQRPEPNDGHGGGPGLSKLERAVEARLREAAARGEFQTPELHGKPIDLESSPYDSGTGALHRVMRQNGALDALRQAATNIRAAAHATDGNVGHAHDGGAAGRKRRRWWRW